MDHYLGALPEMEQQLLQLLNQKPDDHFEAKRLEYAQRLALKQFLDNIDKNAETARQALDEYEKHEADQGDIFDGFE